MRRMGLGLVEMHSQSIVMQKCQGLVFIGISETVSVVILSERSRFHLWKDRVRVMCRTIGHNVRKCTFKPELS